MGRGKTPRRASLRYSMRVMLSGKVAKGGGAVNVNGATRVERSIASTVVLDAERGAAIKTYTPPFAVRLLYWLAFQARFPYESNERALTAAVHRRGIAGFLTRCRFGKDLVAAISAERIEGRWRLVGEFVPGDKVDNDAETQAFLRDVTEMFAAAGLSVWQINPRNPRAHTNLIRKGNGDLVVIDLESAVVTPFPAPGQWRAALRSGSVPVFDDIDFERLRAWMGENEAAVQRTLGDDGLAAFRRAVDEGETSMEAWKGSEPRLWGRLISGVCRLIIRAPR